MKHLLIFTILLFAISCNSKSPGEDTLQELTEAQKRKIYVDSFAFTDRNAPDRRDSVTSFWAFMNKHYPTLKAKNKYDPLIYALEEPYIDTTLIDTTQYWFRIRVNPVFRHPYCFVIEKQGSRNFLTVKVTNGEGGYYAGGLAILLRLPFPDSLFNDVAAELRQLDLRHLPARDTTCGLVLDGEDWMFELIENGHYSLIGRSSPESCGSSQTRQLGEIGIRIRKISRLDKVLLALGERPSTW